MTEAPDAVRDFLRSAGAKGHAAQSQSVTRDQLSAWGKKGAREKKRKKKEQDAKKQTRRRARAA